MAAVVSLLGVEATVKDGEWSCANETVLNLVNEIDFGLHGPSGSIPNPDLFLANRVVQEMGAKLVSFDPTESVAGRIY